MDEEVKTDAQAVELSEAELDLVSGAGFVDFIKAAPKIALSIAETAVPAIKKIL